MATIKKCDRCGKMYEGKTDRTFKTPDGFYVNSVRLGNWDNKQKKWRSLASAYDLCSDCASKLYDILVGAADSQVEMRNNADKKVPAKESQNVVVATAEPPIEDQQMAYAQNELESQADGETDE